ncbi:hypothetical protein GCK32_022653 [Trichostrongylus colubriformis]|uniref:Uncharacterized protein n=1 Tax=Trichostrongylus colubriformis TaxID=6319 RepID=A0AAN8FKS3_TRICO
MEERYWSQLCGSPQSRSKNNPSRSIVSYSTFYPHCPSPTATSRHGSSTRFGLLELFTSLYLDG